MKIAHFGSYGINLGDNAALYHLRDLLGGHDLIEWVDLPISQFHSKKNDVEYVKNVFEGINASCNAILIGGGGLIEGAVNSGYATGWKLPFNREILRCIKIPLICFALGYNTFRSMGGLTLVGIENLELLIEKSVYFSVRNDGSYADLARILSPSALGKVFVDPDPGLICSHEFGRKINPLMVGLQPAWNASEKIMAGRYPVSGDLALLSQYVERQKCPIIPHTPKDYCFMSDSGRYVIDMNQLTVSLRDTNPSSLLKLLYSSVDIVIAMRGHGQMVSIGMNKPFVTLATQDKVAQFARMHGLLDYSVDVGEVDWLARLDSIVMRLKNDRQFLENWYVLRNRAMDEIRSSMKQAIIRVKEAVFI